jgi:BlaI family transcriptional regulator, penicillinase repressor
MPEPLSRRERQIMDILHRRGRASAAEVLSDMEDPPSYSAVRAHLATLVAKGHARHEQESQRYVYSPTTAANQARKSALDHLVHTFFAGSHSQAAAALLDADAKLSPAELDQLAALIEKARKEGR